MRRACVFAQLHLPGLGDLVQRNVLLGVLRRAHPDASITLVVGAGVARRFTQLLTRHLDTDALMCCPDTGDADPARWRGFLADLSDRRFDLCVVDPSTHRLDAGHAREAGVDRRVGVPRGRPSDRDITTPVRLPRGVFGHADLYDYATAFGQALGIAPPSPVDVVPDLPRRREEIPELSAPVPRIGVHPGGARHWNRRWPLDRYAALCLRLVTELGASVYLLGGRSEHPELAALRDRVRDTVPAAVVHTDPSGSLNRTVNLLAGLDLVIGNDSGMAHLAAAVGTPTVVIYGPTRTESYWARVYPMHRGVSLRYPCQDITHAVDEVAGRRCEHDCPVGYEGPNGSYPRCLTDLDVAPVWSATTAQLKAYQRHRSGDGYAR